MHVPKPLRRKLSRLKNNVLLHINRARSIESIFLSIYRYRAWGDGQSISGTGSNLEQTQHISAALPRLFRRYNIRTILDIPCGDFNWMKHVDLSGVDYVGADIVRPVITSDQALHTKSNVKFIVADITSTPLPAVDLILCRDCLVHFSNKHISRAIENITSSRAGLLLTTTFPSQVNVDIATGNWRPLNLQDAPFCFPPPIELINEGYEKDSGFADKSLALWSIQALRDHIIHSNGHGRYKIAAGDIDNNLS